MCATYTGHTFDTVTHLYFAEARFYDAGNRNWISRDPAKDGLNWYEYCASNPTSKWDPLGLSISEIVKSVVGTINAGQEDVNNNMLVAHSSYGYFYLVDGSNNSHRVSQSEYFLFTMLTGIPSVNYSNPSKLNATNTYIYFENKELLAQQASSLVNMYYRSIENSKNKLAISEISSTATPIIEKNKLIKEYEEKRNPLYGRDWKISSFFGYRNLNIEGASNYHRGEDLVSNDTEKEKTLNAPLNSGWFAEVDKIGYDSSRGHYVLIKLDPEIYGDGYYILMQHLSSINVEKGQQIEPEQEIANVGSSGVGSGAHLHITVLMPENHEKSVTVIENGKEVTYNNDPIWGMYAINPFSEYAVDDKGISILQHG